MPTTSCSDKRILSVCVVLVQLVTLPATYELHVGCHNSEQSAKECHSGCHHCHYHGVPDSESDDSDTPHDSDACTVCQVAFAASITDCELPPLESVELVTVLSVNRVTLPDWMPPRRWFGRGPPIFS